MILHSLGAGFYRLTHDQGAQTQKKKTPPNSRSLIFCRHVADGALIVIRGSLMLSKADIEHEIVRAVAA